MLTQWAVKKNIMLGMGAFQGSWTASSSKRYSAITVVWFSVE